MSCCERNLACKDFPEKDLVLVNAEVGETVLMPEKVFAKQVEVWIWGLKRSRAARLALADISFHCSLRSVRYRAQAMQNYGEMR